MIILKKLEIGESRKRTVGERVVIYGVHNLVRSNFEFFMKSIAEVLWSKVL